MRMENVFTEKSIESQNDVGSLGGIFYEKCLGEDYFDQGVFEKQG